VWVCERGRACFCFCVWVCVCVCVSKCVLVWEKCVCEDRLHAALQKSLSCLVTLFLPSSPPTRVHSDNTPFFVPQLELKTFLFSSSSTFRPLHNNNLPCGSSLFASKVEDWKGKWPNFLQVSSLALLLWYYRTQLRVRAWSRFPGARSRATSLERTQREREREWLGNVRKCPAYNLPKRGSATPASNNGSPQYALQDGFHVVTVVRTPFSAPLPPTASSMSLEMWVVKSWEGYVVTLLRHDVATAAVLGVLVVGPQENQCSGLPAEAADFCLSFSSLLSFVMRSLIIK